MFKAVTASVVAIAVALPCLAAPADAGFLRDRIASRLKASPATGMRQKLGDAIKHRADAAKSKIANLPGDRFKRTRDLARAKLTPEQEAQRAEERRRAEEARKRENPDRQPPPDGPRPDTNTPPATDTTQGDKDRPGRRPPKVVIIAPPPIIAPPALPVYAPAIVQPRVVQPVVVPPSRPARQPVAAPARSNDPVCVDGTWATQDSQAQKKYVCLSWFYRGKLYTPDQLQQVLESGQ